MNLAGYQIHNVLKAFTRRFVRRRGHEADLQGVRSEEQMAADVKRQLIIDHVSERILSDIRELTTLDRRFPVSEPGNVSERGGLGDFNAEPVPFSFNVIDENNVKRLQVWDPASSTNFPVSLEFFKDIRMSKTPSDVRLN